MTIKIFNDDPDHYIYPVLTTGKGPVDIWLQAFFKIPANQTAEHPYKRELVYRIYVNPPSGEPPLGGGIAPGQSVTLTLPLYTQLAATVNPKEADQYIDWWNGGRIDIFHSGNVPPRALVEDLDLKLRPKQKTLKSDAKNAVFPTCANCKSLQFFSDEANLPKADPSQLFEYTLGARLEIPVNNAATDPPNALDLSNVDFDVSYVNDAYMPGAMGPVDNDQQGYVGTPQDIVTFTAALDKFLEDFPDWPQYIRRYANGDAETVQKAASPLELFARLSGAAPPPDLTKVPEPSKWPNSVWPPIQVMRDNWLKFAGRVNTEGLCDQVGWGQTEFCDAIRGAKQLMIASFNNYQQIFRTQCKGTALPKLTDEKMLEHVYGWTPFVESTTSPGGCPEKANLLENTPGYSTKRPNGTTDYSKYLSVKLLFDKLNYGTLENSPRDYAFNPWVNLIHRKPYIDAPNVYAYSVDDAMGNIQADGLGFIIDVGGTMNLENQNLASPPINVNLGGASPNGKIVFTKYRRCQNDPKREKMINKYHRSFIISATDPKNCPVFIFDNKPTPQLYTFTVTAPPKFKYFQDQLNAKWERTTQESKLPTTTSIIDCSANPSSTPSSQIWCCDKSSPAGIFAYSTDEPHNPHKTQNHFVITQGPMDETGNPRNLQACSKGR